MLVPCVSGPAGSEGGVGRCRVEALVLFEVVFAGEPPPTLAAMEGLLARVAALVPLQVKLVTETLATQEALARPGDAVDAQVSLKAGLGGEALATVSMAVLLWGRGGAEVGPEITGVEESLRTVRAGQRSLSLEGMRVQAGLRS